MKYVKVIIDNNSRHTDMLYTYQCDDEDIQVGDKVYVPFGKGNREKGAYVFSCMDFLDAQIPNMKNISRKDEYISLNEKMIQLAIWMKDTYLCKYLDGIKCMLPSGDRVKRGVRKDPFSEIERIPDEIQSLTDEQNQVLSEIYPAVSAGEHKVFLLQGVTGSGKTEVYMQVIQKVLEKGKKAIFLVPEISLTGQTVERLIRRFGRDQVAILHSKLTQGQRYDQWMRAKNGDAKILLGARSGVFAPFDDIGVIIVDEEHESSYKSDMTPKYDSVEVAIERGRLHDSIVILGSATPSILSSYRAEQGIYKRLYMNNRYNKVSMPSISVVDMRQELKNGNKSIFSVSLYQQMTETLSTGKQVILFLNRRGYSSFISCRSCGFVVKCEECGISMTYHKNVQEAECHYCGRQSPIPEVCPTCGSKYIRHFGIGTEKVEEMAAIAFPEYGVARLDLDTVKQKGSMDKILGGFRRKKTQILVGTQLVAKGLDFENVGLVGIVSADITLNIPDFRSAERTFQLITQAAGRSGRGDQQGNVVIQTYNPEHYAILAAAANDYRSFYRQELMVRQAISYPPFSDLIQVLITSKEEGLIKQEAEALYEKLCERAEEVSKGEIFRPQPAYRWRMSDTFRYYIIIRCLPERKPTYLKILSEIKSEWMNRGKEVCSLGIDINPYSLG